MKPGQFPENCENSGQNIEIRDFETTQLNSGQNIEIQDFETTQLNSE